MTMIRLEWSRGARVVIAVAIWVVAAGCGDGSKGRKELATLLRSGQEQMQKGRYREAVVTFEKAISLDGKAPEPYMRLALIYEECLHDPATALSYYRKYQQVEKDAVKKEEVRGWIVQLERAMGERGGGEQIAGSPGGEAIAGEGGAGGSGPSVSGRRSATASSVAVEESPAYKELEAKLASALDEIERLKGSGTPESSLLDKLAESERRVKELEGEKESLSGSVREARAEALLNRQAAAQAEEKKDRQRSVYEGQIADLKKRLDAADARVREVEAGARAKRTEDLENELREAKRQRDLARSEYSSAADEIARLKKMLKTYAATVSSLHKINDELRKENASLRSRSAGGVGGVRYHTVRAGETLRKIAGYGSVYGESDKWVVIYEANRDKISDPNRLRPGLVLVIPPG